MCVYLLRLFVSVALVRERCEVLAMYVLCVECSRGIALPRERCECDVLSVQGVGVECPRPTAMYV